LPSGILHINIAEAEEEAGMITPEDDTYIATGISNVVTITHLSNINKLLTVTAYVLRFNHNLPQQQEAEKFWISSSQHLCFQEELSFLMKRNKHHCPTLV